MPREISQNQGENSKMPQMATTSWKKVIVFKKVINEKGEKNEKELLKHGPSMSKNR